MSLSLRSFSTVVSTAVAAAQGACTTLLDMTVGTPGRALMEAVGGVTLWLQYIAIQILLTTRLATSQGSDCDSFVADFGMARLAGVAATGSVTMTSFTPANASATIVPGQVVRTVGAINFLVVKDSALPTWSTTASGYVRPAGMASITVPVQAETAGSSGNVAEGAICLLGSSISGIDTVTNGAAFVNGADGETDTALRARFPLWLAAKATASVAAIENAIEGVQTNLTYSIQDGAAPDGTVRAGYFTATINDGSGAPSDTVLSNVYAAIDAVRACGVGFAVVDPTDLTLAISMTVTVPSGSSAATVQAAIETAIAADIGAQAVSAGYAYARLAYLAYSSAGVTVLSVNDVLLNGGQADIPSTTGQALVAGTISVSVLVTT
jgi:uncharacterized phage protein gp47/JayE